MFWLNLTTFVFAAVTSKKQTIKHGSVHKRGQSSVSKTQLCVEGLDLVAPNSTAHWMESVSTV